MKILLKTGLICVLAAALPACSDAKPQNETKVAVENAATQIKNVDATQAAELINTDGSVTVIDVRTPGEFASGHIKGAKNISINSRDFSNALSALDKDVTYVVHCRSGGRSRASLKTFRKLGFKNIVHMDGGIVGWRRAGLPLER